PSTSLSALLLGQQDQKRNRPVALWTNGCSAADSIGETPGFMIKRKPRRTRCFAVKCAGQQTPVPLLRQELARIDRRRAELRDGRQACAFAAPDALSRVSGRMIEIGRRLLVACRR